MKETIITIIFLLLIALIYNPGDRNIQNSVLDIGGAQIHYKVDGAGEAVLFLHGGYLDLSMWDCQTDDLVHAGYQVVRYSDIGHGKTESGEENIFGYKIANRLMDELGIEKIHVIGLSWGAMTAVDLAMAYPKKTERLILVSPGLNGWQYFADSLAAENHHEGTVALEQGDTLRFIEAFQKNWTDGPRRASSQVNAGVRKKIGSMILNNLRKHSGSSWSKLRSPSSIHLEKINCPVLVVHGEHDVLDIHQIVDLLSEKIPEVQTVELKGVAHTLNMENPKEFNELIIEFLAM